MPPSFFCAILRCQNHMVAAAIIIAVTYIGIAFARIPKVNIDRPSAAFIGAVLMVLAGVLSFNEAVSAIDFNTIALLLGMMVVVSVLNRAGFFALLAIKSLVVAKTPKRLLLVVVVATAVSSAFLINDVVVLLFTPVVIRACRMMRVNPIPYLIAEAMASNVGSTATIIGNPQNMLIGINSGISFTRFFLYLSPVALLSTAALIAVIYLFYRKEFEKPVNYADDPKREGLDYNLKAIKWVTPVLAVTVILFFLSSSFDLPLPVIGLGSAAVALVVGRMNPSEVIKGVDWLLLVFFVGLFVVIGGANHAGIFDSFLNRISITPNMSGVASISAFSVTASQLTSNVPLTMLVMPVIQNVPGHLLWVALAAGATLGGNLTIIGAVSNIIVAEGASKEGIRLNFVEFLKVGAVVTAVTVGISLSLIAAEYHLGFLK